MINLSIQKNCKYSIGKITKINYKHWIIPPTKKWPLNVKLFYLQLNFLCNFILSIINLKYLHTCVLHCLICCTCVIKLIYCSQTLSNGFVRLCNKNSSIVNQQHSFICFGKCIELVAWFSNFDWNIDNLFIW